jgi:cell division protein FtsW
VIAEEFGFVGVCVVVTLFALFTWRALRTGLRCMELRQPFNGYVAFGIGMWISLQAFVSMGVNLGILPTKGLTLPLISSGGSSVLMTCAAYGMLLRISCELDRAERRHAARVRGDNAGRIEPAFEETESAPLSGNRGQSAPTATPASIAAELRGQRARVEPRFGAQR